MDKKQLIEEMKLEEIPELLKNPGLINIINKEFDKFIVDEEETRKAVFICACGVFVNNLASTFNVLLNGESSAGKSWIAKNVLKIFPEQVFSKKTYRTRISPNALTYWHNSNAEPDWNWNGKILYLEDIGNNILNCDVFKVMISEGSTATIVGRQRDKNKEMPTTYDIEIIGKPITFITTAMGTPIEEIKNRFLMIDLDETEKQTDKIMEMQLNRAIDGKRLEYDEKILNSFSFLKRVDILLPDWIKKIKEFIPRKDVLRWRREFPRFLEIIKCSAALHQFQRKKEENGKIIANEQDYEIARGVIGKISASSGAEGLTHRERAAFEYIKEFYKVFDKGCSKSEIYAFKPIYTERTWDVILGKLAEKGLLSIKLEINPETNRKGNHYYPIDLNNLFLPEFKDLMVEKDVNDVNTQPLYNTHTNVRANSHAGAVGIGITSFTSSSKNKEEIEKIEVESHKLLNQDLEKEKENLKKQLDLFGY